MFVQELNRATSRVHELHAVEDVPGARIELHLIWSAGALQQLLELRRFANGHDPIVFSMKDQDWRHSGDSTDQERVAAFRDRLLDDAEYEIHALEV